jgi:hypothetical protein
MESTGHLRFNQRMPPEHGSSIEYQCPICGTIAPVRERDKIPLVREILQPSPLVRSIFRPLFEGE